MRALRQKLTRSRWLRTLFGRKAGFPPDIQRAMDLMAAIDAGGVPLNAARVNAIARDLGLEVSSKAPAAETIERLRAALKRYA